LKLADNVLGRRYDFWAAFAGALLGTLGAALAYLVLLERHAVADALFLRELVPRPFERRLIDVVLICKTTLFGSVPAVLFATLEARGRKAWALGAYLSSLWFCFFFFIADLHIYALHGRHLLQILAFAALPEGQQAGGSVSLWLARFSAWALQAAGLSVCGLGCTLAAALLWSQIRSRPIRAVMTVPLVIGLLGAAPVAVSQGAGWQTAGLQARLLGVLPLSFGAERMIRTHVPSDPIQAELQLSLNAVYQQKFSYLFRKRAPQLHVRTQPKSTPNVFLILVESWRADVLTADLMPELYAWAQHGLRRSRHYSGTNFSESATFTIMYGSSALPYHAVLDSRVPPPLCEGLRALSYKCAYYTGHPTIWWRREEFLGPDTFDIHERTQQGTWNDWDEHALSALTGLAKRAPDGGYLGITFLMSTHYEYRYPPAFERFVPADEPAISWAGAGVRKNFEPLANRYKNAVGFVDHLIGEALRQIDTDRDYVIVTGDHAEGLGEYGKIGHGYDFSDALLHVPFVLRGPGIPAQELGGLSLHQDIWPTVLSLASGTKPTEHDLRNESHRSGALMAHCDFDQIEADAMLLEGDVRVRLTLGLRTPEVHVQGFEDARGWPVESPHLSKEQMAALTNAFDRYLDDAASPVLLVH
jgi:Sulfatase